MKNRLLIPALILLVTSALPAWAQETELDRRVRAFLDSHARQWRDMNVPMVDGQALYDVIVEHTYTRAVEVGTSTGHSGIWIAWALSKTGGKLVTIEIDAGRHRQAVANFEAAGLSDFVDARLADAHELVPQLEGPYDFVFVDADKDGYTQYFKWLLPKLEVGGCFTAHNVSAPSGQGGRGGRGGRGGMGMMGTGAFVQELMATPGLETTFFRSGGGLSISYKKPPE
jgi:caffeoyl-CoA O-methyltransferase